jgi:hypothetical protein
MRHKSSSASLLLADISLSRLAMSHKHDRSRHGEIMLLLFNIVGKSWALTTEPKPLDDQDWSTLTNSEPEIALTAFHFRALYPSFSQVVYALADLSTVVVDRSSEIQHERKISNASLLCSGLDEHGLSLELVKSVVGSDSIDDIAKQSRKILIRCQVCREDGIFSGACCHVLGVIRPSKSAQATVRQEYLGEQSVLTPTIPVIGPVAPTVEQQVPTDKWQVVDMWEADDNTKSAPSLGCLWYRAFVNRIDFEILQRIFLFKSTALLQSLTSPSSSAGDREPVLTWVRAVDFAERHRDFERLWELRPLVALWLLRHWKLEATFSRVPSNACAKCKGENKTCAVDSMSNACGCEVRVIQCFRASLTC